MPPRAITGARSNLRSQFDAWPRRACRRGIRSVLSSWPVPTLTRSQPSVYAVWQVGIYVLVTIGALLASAHPGAADPLLEDTIHRLERLGERSRTLEEIETGSPRAAELYRECVFGEVEAACSELSGLSPGVDPVTPWAVAVAFRQRGDIRRARGDHKGSLEDYRKALLLHNFPDLLHHLDTAAIVNKNASESRALAGAPSDARLNAAESSMPRLRASSRATADDSPSSTAPGRHQKALGWDTQMRSPIYTIRRPEQLLNIEEDQAVVGPPKKTDTDFRMAKKKSKTPVKQLNSRPGQSSSISATKPRPAPPFAEDYIPSTLNQDSDCSEFRSADAFPDAGLSIKIDKMPRKENDSLSLQWSADRHFVACKFTGSNGETMTGFGGKLKISTPIQQETYKLVCKSCDGGRYAISYALVPTATLWANNNKTQAFSPSWALFWGVIFLAGIVAFYRTARSASPTRVFANSAVERQPDKVSQSFRRDDDSGVGCLVSSQEERESKHIRSCHQLPIEESKAAASRTSPLNSPPINSAPQPNLQSAEVCTNHEPTRPDELTSIPNTTLTSQYLQYDDGKENHALEFSEINSDGEAPFLDQELEAQAEKESQVYFSPLTMQYNVSRETKDQASQDLVRHCEKGLLDSIVETVLDKLAHDLTRIGACEHIFDCIAAATRDLAKSDMSDFRAKVNSRFANQANEYPISAKQELLDGWCDYLVRMWRAILQELPANLSPATELALKHSGCSKLLVDCLSNGNSTLQSTVGFLLSTPDGQRNYFETLRSRMTTNIDRLSKEADGEALVGQEALRSLRRHFIDTEILLMAFAETPFEDLLRIEVQCGVPIASALGSAHLLVGQARAKNALVSNLVKTKLDAVGLGERSIVTISSDHALMSQLNEMITDTRDDIARERLVVLGNNSNLTLGLRDVFPTPPGEADALERERLLNSAFDHYSFFFEAIFGAALLQENRSALRHIVRLLQLVPQSDLRTLCKVCDPQCFGTFARYVDQIRNASTRKFFKSRFNDPCFAPVLLRFREKLEAFLEDPVVAHPTNAQFDSPGLGQAIEHGRIILVDLSEQVLGNSSAVPLARLSLAQMALLGLFRDGTALGNTRQGIGLTIIVDGMPGYFQRAVAPLELFIRQIRNAGFELIMAHQSLSEISAKMWDVVARHQPILLAGQIAHNDADTLANLFKVNPKRFRDTMQCDDEFRFVAMHQRQLTSPSCLRVPLSLDASEIGGAKEQKPSK